MWLSGLSHVRCSTPILTNQLLRKLIALLLESPVYTQLLTLPTPRCFPPILLRSLTSRAPELTNREPGMRVAESPCAGGCRRSRSELSLPSFTQALVMAMGQHWFFKNRVRTPEDATKALVCPHLLQPLKSSNTKLQGLLRTHITRWAENAALWGRVHVGGCVCVVVLRMYLCVSEKGVMRSELWYTGEGLSLGSCLQLQAWA